MADSLAAIAQDTAASTAERHDAQVEFAKSHGTAGLASHLLPTAEIQPVIEHIQGLFAEQELAKAARGQLIKGPWKAKSTIQGGQSVFLDDFQIQTQGAYWDRPGVLGFDAMRSMVDQTPILNGIVLTRIRQVNSFCRPQSGSNGAGFVIQHVDPNVELTDKQNGVVQRLQQFMINCGDERDPRKRKRMKRDSFSQFMAKSVRDTLTMDAAPIETEFKRDRALGLDGFYALDGASIRLCTEQGYEGDDEVFALQVIQGQIRTAYTYDDLVYEVRNPRTDVNASGYGYSETEMLIRVVTYLLNTMSYNAGFFDKNSIPRGILNVFGSFSTEDISAFKRQWNAMQRGVSNAHNLPVMVSKDQESAANFTEIGGQMTEMAFGKWISFLTSISCAIYGVAPEEISMESFATTGKGLSGSDTEEKLVSANDKGLRPLLGYYEGVFSDFVIQTFSPEYNFKFVGLDVEDAKNRFEMRKLVSTLNEGRASLGMDAIKDKLGDAPLNPVLLPAWQQESGVGLPPEPEEDFGDPDAADADGDQPPGAGGPPEQAAGDAVDDGAPDFGAPGSAMTKAFTHADFGLSPQPIYSIEV
ncbi:phage portal protein [Phenylobacterium ferrooxidans]|uniref:Phage portal protein n=1 Tax=Phenylobacterium ferrooxidans TaxID=2982689 RepID=A0ABW6CJE3_9CAUL